MLSYRHAFHAGNSADVLKHSVLVFCLEYLLQKDKPLLCADTHAGAGSYSLHEGFAAQNCEWKQGLEKIIGKVLPPLLSRYFNVCFPEAAPAKMPVVYPGSPLIMSRLLRPADRLVCFELHPADYAACKSAINAEVRQEDGFTGLKSLLPPPSRRGLVFIDPSYELMDDYSLVPETLAVSLKRFTTGTYIVWYPLLNISETREFPRHLFNLYSGNRCLIELYTSDKNCTAHSPRGMYGSGLVIFNPPWTLAAALTECMPFLGKYMGCGETGWKLETA